jgi:hypothetical protein
MPELGRFEGKDGLKYLLETAEPLHGSENTEEARVAMQGLTEMLLRVRDRSGRNVRLSPNRAQLEFERRRGQRNIVLKARQMGISTWVSGRLFLKTVTKPGTRTVQVAHDLSVMKSQMSTLLGDGNSGRIATIKGRVDQHERSLQRAKGFAVAMGAVFTLIQCVVELLRRK